MGRPPVLSETIDQTAAAMRSPIMKPQRRVVACFIASTERVTIESIASEICARAARAAADQVRARCTTSASYCGVVARPRISPSRSERMRRSHRFDVEPRELVRTTIAVPTAIVARSRSGRNLRAIPQTTCATTATATILSPYSHGESTRLPNTPSRHNQRIIASADGIVKSSQAQTAPGTPARKVPILIPTGPAKQAEGPAYQATWRTEIFFGDARGGRRSDYLLGDFPALSRLMAPKGGSDGSAC